MKDVTRSGPRSQSFLPSSPSLLRLAPEISYLPSWVSKSVELLTDVEVVRPPAVATRLARLTSQRHLQYDLIEP